MKVKTQHCLITLGKMTVISKCVPLWEAEVLAEKFGGQCEFTKKGETDVPELPDTEGEFVRLQDAHGFDEDTKVAFVQDTFGRGKRGLEELQKSMKRSVVRAKKKPGPKPAAVTPGVKTESKSEPDPFE